MKEFFYSKKFKVIICIFALLLGIIIYTAVNAGTSLPKKIVETLTSPFVSLGTNVSNWVEEKIDTLVNANKYKLENETLRKQLTEMYSGIKDMDELEKEVEELRKILEIKKENDDFKFSPPCRVIARGAIDVSNGFTIDKGSNDGIEKNDPVLTEIGLIGIVSEIAPTYSKVLTILSPEISIGVTTVENHTIGIIENTVDYAAEGKCLMGFIDKNSVINIGDVIMTPGGHTYPAGLIIGTVSEIFTDDNELSLHAVIIPSVNTETVTNCFVITDFEGQGVQAEQ